MLDVEAALRHAWWSSNVDDLGSPALEACEEGEARRRIDLTAILDGAGVIIDRR